jgi:glycosyltransferase involved in cell wall biosynthesis
MALRIVHVVSSIDPRFGGVAVAVTGLAVAQRRAGMDVHVVSTFPAGTDLSPADRLREQGVVVDIVGPGRGRLLRHPDLAGAIDRAAAGADVIHVHALWEEAQHLAAVIARRRRVPYVLAPHGMLDPWSLRQSKWVKRLYMFWRLRYDLNRAAAIHFTTTIERDLAAATLRLAPASIVEPNGLDFSEFDPPPARGRFRASHAIAPDRPVVLFLSRIHPKKGLDLLVPALARSGLADALLVIAGPDESGYRPEVERLIAQHALGDRVLFTGMLKGAARVEAFVDADLFALPSYQENFGIAVAEALACGTPVVISDQVNIHPEITAAGVGGVVPLDVERLAAELRRWMTDISLRQTAAARAPGFVRERYDWNQIARRWAGHYAKLVERAGRRRMS